MIYVVSGFQRSGTSMMMQALKAGGMEVYFDPQHEKKLQSDHVGDNDSYLEVGTVDVRDYQFPKQHEGKVIKILAPWISLGQLAVAQYRVVLMFRDPREIAVSLARLYGGALPAGDSFILNRYSYFMDKAIRLMTNRRDVESVTVVQYRGALEEPVGVFQELANNEWPVDPEKAAAVIDPERCRVRFEGPDDVAPVKALRDSIGAEKRQVFL